MAKKTPATLRRFRRNLTIARQLWPSIVGRTQEQTLRELSVGAGLSVAAGDILMLEGRWYVTHAGLLRIAGRRGCLGILVEPVDTQCDAAARRWVFRATVYPTTASKGFTGYGDADPSNVSDVVRGAELRIAETRAVNRALRKAYGIGLCSVEELGAHSSPPPAPAAQKKVQPAGSRELVVVNGNGQPRLRDRLAQLIRQHRLDPELVKLYAADFCGTETLRDAGRELIEDFINTLAEWARSDRDGLLCKLNSYAAPGQSGKESAA